MADDIKNVLIDNWDATIITKGTIDYIENHPVEAVGNGIILRKAIQKNIPETIQAPFGFEFYIAYLVHTSLDNLNSLILELIHICDGASHFASNTIYYQFFVDVDNVQHLTEWKEKPLTNFWRISTLNIWCPLKAIAGHRIGDPRYSTRLGEAK